MIHTRCIHCDGTGRQNLRFRNSTILCSPNGACKPCTEIASIQERIDDTFRALHKLIEEKEMLAGAFNAEHDQLCCKLPQELVSEVFFHTLPFTLSVDVFQK